MSFTGGLMQNAALLWHVSLLAPPGQKGLALGGVGLVKVVPIVGFAMLSGMAADALDRRKLMIVTNTCAAFVALALAFVTWRGVTSLWPLYALAFVGAIVATFDPPARQSLVPMLVPRDDLPSAIGLNAIMMQAASVTGPALAGILIATTSLEWVYLANALSFGSVIIAVLMMRGISGRAQHHEGEKPDISLRSAVEGLRFVFRSPLIRSTMLLDFFATFFSSATALLPIFAQDILQIGPEGYGWLYAAPAAGALAMSAGMVLLTSRIQRRGPVLLWAVALYGAATVGFGLSRSFWVTWACLALTGVADAVSMVIRNIVRQLETPDHLRGRMMGVNMIFFQGGPQLGEIEAGAVANWFGAPFAVITGGIGALVATAWVAASTPELRAYRAKPVTTVRAMADGAAVGPEI